MRTRTRREEQPHPRQTMKQLVRLDRETLRNAALTTVAAGASLVIAQACRLPEAYWAVVSTIIVTQSSIGQAWNISLQRLAGTLLGGVTAVLLVMYFRPGLVLFVAGLLGLGLVCSLFASVRNAYRFSAITVAIIMLPSRNVPVATAATHRFFEVTLGLIVGVAASAAVSPRELLNRAISAKGG